MAKKHRRHSSASKPPSAPPTPTKGDEQKDYENANTNFQKKSAGGAARARRRSSVSWQKPKREEWVVLPVWKPAAHTCPVCAQPTTSTSFKRACLGNEPTSHQAVCPKFHQTLMRPNKLDTCYSCVRESEMVWKRHRELEDSLIAEGKMEPRMIGSGKHRIPETPTAGGARKKHRKSEEVQREIENVALQTLAGTEWRHDGYVEWTKVR